MTGFLVKRFVKDHDNVEDVRVRTAYGTLTSMVGIGCNLLLFVSKLCIGILVHSISVMRMRLIICRMRLPPLLDSWESKWRKNLRMTTIPLVTAE